VTSVLLPLAHGLVIGRQDLPIPTWLFAWGASLVLIVSFVALSVAWRDSKFSSDGWRPAPEWLSRLLTGRPVEIVTGAVGVFLLGAVVYSGIEGTDQPNLNFAATFVFVTFWIGMVVLSVLLGDVFRAFNPWRAIARATGGLFRLIAGQPHSPPLRYPEQLGRWPAVAGILAFVWRELVYAISGFDTVGLEPSAIAVATLVYTAYTLVAMALFGVETWLGRGEAFSVYYGMFSQLAPLEVRGRQLGIRRPLAAATRWAFVPGSLALVVTTIAATIFDGAQDGLWREPVADLFERFSDLGLGPTAAFRLSQSVFLALTLAGVAAIYWAGVRGMQTVRDSPPLGSLGRLFAHTLIPIGVAYVRGAGAVHLPALGPVGRRLRPVRHGLGRDRLRAPGREHDLVRAGGGVGHRTRRRPRAGPRSRHHGVRRSRPRLPIAAVDAARDGRLHVPGPVPALAVQRVMLLLAHVTHWYFWPLYGLPVLIVLWSVIATTVRERRASRDEETRRGK
jgi:hypothetical protein